MMSGGQDDADVVGCALEFEAAWVLAAYGDSHLVCSLKPLAKGFGVDLHGGE